MANIKRISLLSEIEINDLYARPDFNNNERTLYFAINEHEYDFLSIYSNVRTRVYFILQLGYFKAKQQLFNFTFEDVSDDVEYILFNFFNGNTTALSGCISRNYLDQQKKDILKLFDYQDWSSEHRTKIEKYICELLRYYPKNHSALRQLLSYLDNKRIVIPTYRTLQDMFTAAFSTEEKRIGKIISSMPLLRKHQLSTLVNKENGITQFNILRADQKDFHYTAIRVEVDKAQEIDNLYNFCKKFIPRLNLSKNAVRYYADVAEQYPASRLRRLTNAQQLLHIICFIYHRYQQIMDNLITSFMYHTKAIKDSGKSYAGLTMMEHSSTVVADFSKLAQFLDWFPNRNKNLNHDALNYAAYNILPEKQFSTLANFFKGNTFDKTAAEWKFYLKSSRMFSLYLRPIFLTVQFEHYKEGSKITKLINLLKTHYDTCINPSMLKLSDDVGLIPKNIIPYLKRERTDEHIDPYLFEFYVYQKICHQLERGVLYCNDSISYCDIDQDLVGDTLVDDVEKIAAEFGYPKIPTYCDDRLDDAIKMLDLAWDRTTDNIQRGNNTSFNLKETKTGQQDWSLLYDSSEQLDDSFFKTLPQVELADIIMFIGDKVDMWNGFSHLKNRYTKRKKPIILAVNACLMSQAFGIGEMKMAEMSDLNFNLLRSTREDFIRIDTLCGVNDKISNYICSLPIFKLWNLLDDKLLADTDGQKFSTSDSTIQSRYSKKYFGKGKGISLYTLIANFVAVNAKNIGLNEYEGHSLFDMIYGNKTDIDINMVTGDNHSLNKLNFVALDAIDVEYVPSIKNVREMANDLCSVKTPDIYFDYLKPKSKINITRIKSQKRGILRVLLSLIMQENTQSNIIRKLNSHARYNRLKAALFEYNKIFKSIHLLHLIDDMQFRKAIRTARNRTESYHQLQSFIRKIYNGIFKGRRIIDNRISAHAARLIANCIIAYNSTILTAVYEKMIRDGVSQDIIDEFARISPISWAHILFSGRYNFQKSTGKIDVAEMAKIVELHLKQHFWKLA